jgi:hypothetical protein
MQRAISRFLDQFSEFYAHRKGLLPLLGIVLVILNYLLQLFPAGWISETDLFLHLGIVLAILGFLLAKTL